MRRISLSLLFLLLSGIFTVKKAAAQDVVVSYQTFYDELTPYGQWVDDAEYGNVWVPNEAAGYRPYATNGHWAMTESGNMWVSDAPYGWACYHYGRWTYNPYYGWVWIPGHEWAPAWVSWRSGGGYYGWAPMGPGYVAGGTYDYPDNYWVFVGPQYLYQPNVYSYYEDRHIRRYIRESNYINETYVDNGYHATYYYGPRREAIERETHQPVQVYQVSGASGPRQTSVTGNVVQVYRPAINEQSRNTARPTTAIRGSEPVGRPQSFTRGDARREPEFRQQVQSGNVNNNIQSGRTQQTNRPQQQSFQQLRNNNTTTNTTQGRPQQQHFQPQPQNTNQGRPQPQPNSGQPQMNRPQPQGQQQRGQQPQRQQQQRSGKTQESEKRGR